MKNYEGFRNDVREALDAVYKKHFDQKMVKWRWKE
jgi:hypothetical protein